MKAMSCAAVRRRLQAFHDGELPVTEQIAVQGHLEGCGGCGDSLADLRQNEAVMLFVERAAAASGSFDLSASNEDAVVDLCRRIGVGFSSRV